MRSPLLGTKFYIPPVRPELVSRPRLIERLDAGMARKLTLVSAPAGYGKTTLLIEWIYQGGNGTTPALPVAWLSLDEEDNDPVRFLSYLVRATQMIVPRLGEGLLGTLQTPRALPIETILTSLINELTEIPRDASRCCLLGLVLDDYHLIERQEIHDAVAFLLDHLPPPPEGVHLVIATRKDPLLPLPRWRAGAHMVDVREADLRFTHEEAKEFLKRAMGLPLSIEQVAVLEARTEGWIAGLQLAALSMQGLETAGIADFIAAFAGDDRHVADYLIDEVLAQRPPGTKDFLLQTSILERMSGPLCDAVTGRQGGQDVLKVLEQANLFVVSLDSRRQWYRYHRLFADLLQHRLRATVGTSDLSSLHLRASKWYGQRGLVAEAVHHALAAKDSERAADLVEQSARDMLERSELALLMGLVGALPEHHVRTRPWLCVYHAWALRLTGAGLQAVESRLRDAERALERQQALPHSPMDNKALLDEDETTRVLGHIAALRAYQALYREEIPRAKELAHQALQSGADGDFVRSSVALALGWAYRFSGDLAAADGALNEARDIGQASGNTYLSVTAACRAAHGLVLAGKLRQAASAYEEALQMATLADGQRLPVAGYAYVYLGGVHREWNDLDTAARYLTEGIALCAQVGYLMDQVVGYVNMARVCEVQGDHDGARDALLEGERLSQKMTSYLYVRRWVEDCQVRLWLAQGDLDAAARWADRSGLRADDEVSFLRELERIILARVRVAQGLDQPGERYLSDALDLLARLLDAAETAGWMGKAIEILVLQALALQGQGDTVEAVVALERAMTLAEPQGYIRTFVDEGAPMALLLQEALAQDVAPGYTRRLLDALEAGEPGPAESPLACRAARTLVDPLTARELEVLHLLRTDLSGPEIAAELVVSINTVKTHIKRIYGKLGVHSRYEAVQRAQDLDLL